MLGRDVLEIAQQLRTREQPSSSGSIMRMNASSWFKNAMRQQQPSANNQHFFNKQVFIPPTGDGKFRRYPHPSTRSEAWARQFLSPEHP
ncbi:hypothetical protein O181_068810 [Austropuccinia psidii MF-1]|uniref:Uncharacterized protein n=1 Tax=Austropuccinia psidii MF-1 TaxID=1389203 RepID=A0A9Q3ET93_9BASI|nr:hypothetical protein [Austropuccinia psidii MF-1]